jgi:hypothetical protein
MDAQLTGWKQAVERVWSAPHFDHRAAALLAAEIARESSDESLRQRATQALPSLRGATAPSAERRTKEVSQRLFAAIRDCLHTLTAPRFGKRRPFEPPETPEERHRRVLGLPLGRRLFGSEIQQAYKRAAKTMHPDVGGSAGAFLELAAARDALMKQL